MLVLSRKRGQGLLIDGSTVIRVLEVRGNQVRLGIEAPSDIPVLRTELCEFHLDAPEAASAICGANQVNPTCVAQVREPSHATPSISN